MSTHKNIDKICIIITICAFLISVLFMNGKSLGMTSIVDEDAESYSGSEYFTANDLNGDWDTSDAVNITLQGDTASYDGNGVYVLDGSIYITGAEKYVLSGTLTDGGIIVDAYDSSKVYLMLAGVDISCSDDAGIRVEQADKVFLTLKDGTDNTVTSGETYSDEALDAGVNAAVFSHDDLTINGGGSLAVTAGYRHGIVSKDDLIITGGTVTVNAPVDAIRANDHLNITGADVSVTAGDDGVVINKEGGSLYMESGTLDIVSDDDGVHAAGDVTVAGGDITVSAGDDGIHSDTAFLITAGNITINDCYEGIEAITIDIDGGDITIYPTDDGLNANGGSGDMFGMGGGPGGGMGGRGMRGGSVSGDDMDMQRPDFAVSGDDMGMHMPYDQNVGFEVSGDNADMQRPDFSEVEDTTTDSASADASSDDSEDSEEDEETYVKITDGTLTIINDSGNDADGIDSNGDLIITGGTIRVSLVNNGNNSALDYGSESGGVAEISGGTVIAAGNYSMAEQFDSSSSQASILYTYSEGAEAGTTVALEDTDGNVIISYEVPQSFSSINISCPEMEVGETYLMVIGDNVEEITLDEISASYGDASSGGFGGTMNFGGMMDRGSFGGFGGGHGGRGMHGGSASSNGMDFDRPFPPACRIIVGIWPVTDQCRAEACRRVMTVCRMTIPTRRRPKQQMFLRAHTLRTLVAIPGSHWAFRLSRLL